MKPQKIENQIYILESKFNNTFFHNFKLVLENSNVNEEIRILDDLYSKLLTKTQTEIVKKDILLVQQVLDAYTFILNEFKALQGINIIPAYTKRFEVIKQLREAYFKQDEKIEDIQEKLNLISAYYPQPKKGEIKKTLTRKERVDRRIQEFLTKGIK